MATLTEVDAPSTLEASLRLTLGHAMLANDLPIEPVRTLFLEALPYASRARSPLMIARNLCALATAVAGSEPETAARLLGATIAVRRHYGLTPQSAHQSYDADILHARKLIQASIGVNRFHELTESTRQITLDQAVDLARTLTN